MSTALSALVTVCEQAAAGDLEARVATLGLQGDDLRLAQAINRLLDVSDAYVRESTAAMETCARGEYHRPILEQGLQGAYRLAASTINQAILKMQRDAAQITRFEKERAELANEIAHSVDRLNHSTEDIWKNAETTRDTSAAVARATDETAASVGAVAAACQELTNTTAEISQQTQSSATLVRETVVRSEHASKVVQELSAATKQISTVTGVISKIARQTNLLALNATIEAARAGEHGRGFAVVASEVKNLSRETAAATDRIGTLLDTIGSTTRNVTQAIEHIGAAIQKVDTSSSVISRSAHEQVQATEEIARHLSEVSGNTQAIAQRIGGVARAAEGFTAIATSLKTSSSALAEQTRRLKGETARSSA